MKMDFSSNKLGLLTGTVLLFAAVTTRADLDDHISKSFKVADGGKLTMQVDRGSIEIKTGGGDSVNVDVTRTADYRDRSREEEILQKHKVEISQDGNNVLVHSELEGESKLFQSWGNKLKVKYVVTVPQKYNVDLKTSGGGISINDLEGDVKARTSGGSLQFGQINGPVFGRTSGGSIQLDGCKQVADIETSGGSLSIGEVEGPVTAKTSGGSISIQRAKGEVTARTTGGNILVEDAVAGVHASTSGGSVKARLSSQPKGDCSLETSGGSIDVTLAENLAFDLDASTSGGRVTTDFPVAEEGGKKKRTALKSKLNGGGPALILHTSGGNVRVKKG